jgi:hypothetical protein
MSLVEGNLPQGLLDQVAPGADPAPLCWICKKNKADSGEHKTKRSDLLAVLGKVSQKQPFFYSDTKKKNQVVGSLDAKILKSPVRICAHCNNARTQPHDRAWERMSDRLDGWSRRSQPTRRKQRRHKPHMPPRTIQTACRVDRRCIQWSSARRLPSVC